MKNKEKILKLIKDKKLVRVSLKFPYIYEENDQIECFVLKLFEDYILFNSIEIDSFTTNGYILIKSNHINSLYRTNVENFIQYIYSKENLIKEDSRIKKILKSDFDSLIDILSNKKELVRIHLDDNGNTNFYHCIIISRDLLTLSFKYINSKNQFSKKLKIVSFKDVKAISFLDDELKLIYSKFNIKNKL